MTGDKALSPGTTLTHAKPVTDDQPYRYGEASGDMNPIHTDPEFAESVGFDGVILQGLCTMTFVHQALADWSGGDPDAVESLEVRFLDPVYPGDKLTIEGLVEAVEDGVAEVNVTVVDQDGDQVLAGRGKIRAS